MPSFPIPTRLLHRIVDSTGAIRSIALCPDFAVGKWRYKLLADHLFDWLPDVALRPKERLSLLYEPNKTLAVSCRRLFTVKDPSKRGEIGEILLHAICRQEFHTAPFIARLFYKMRSNDSITSIDVAHVFYDEDTEKLELWLGEAKLYDNPRSARYKALESVKPLWDPEFIEEMKALVGPKLDEGAPYEAELAKIFQHEASLDQIISRIVIPICIAADFKDTVSAGSRTEAYIKSVSDELSDATIYFRDRIPLDVRFVVIFIPLDCKKKLETAVSDKVNSYL